MLLFIFQAITGSLSNTMGTPLPNVHFPPSTTLRPNAYSLSAGTGLPLHLKACSPVCPFPCFYRIALFLGVTAMPPTYPAAAILLPRHEPSLCLESSSSALQPAIPSVLLTHSTPFPIQPPPVPLLPYVLSLYSPSLIPAL